MVPVDNNSFVSDIKQLIEQSRRTAYAAVNSIMIDTYWHIGQRIVEQEQQGEKRAEYGKQIIKMLSKELTQEYGEGWRSAQKSCRSRIPRIQPRHRLHGK